MKLRDKVALVTGGGRGIGRAICLAFASEGADIVVSSDKENENIAVVAEIENMGGRAAHCQLDVADSAQVRTMAEEVMSEFGRVDVLVNNAGIMRRALLAHSDEREWKRVIEVVVYGTYHCCKAFVPQMMERDYGRIINISSIAGKIGNPGNSSYTVAKHGIIGLTRTLAAEVAMLGAKGITVNAVCPGITNTDMVTGPDGTLAKISEVLGLSREEVWEQILKKKVVQERLLEPVEIANMVLYLASDDAHGITGQAINVCGGTVMH